MVQQSLAASVQFNPQTIDAPLFDGILTMGKLLGMSRSVALVFATLYSQDGDLSVEDIQDVTHLSKSSVSLALRDLIQLGIALEVNKIGERCRYYTGHADFAETVRRMMLLRITPLVMEYRNHILQSTSSAARLDQAKALLTQLDQVIEAQESRTK